MKRQRLSWLLLVSDADMPLDLSKPVLEQAIANYGNSILIKGRTGIVLSADAVVADFEKGIAFVADKLGNIAL